jgi:DNA-binding NtrC family response regulator
MMEACLQRLCRKYGAERQLSPASERLLSSYTWPGNVRQLIGMTTSGYAMADGLFIEPKDLAAQMDDAGLTQFSPPPSSMPSMPETSTNIASAAPLAAPTMFEQLVARGDNFWTAVYQRFMARDLNRGEVRSFIRAGLDATQGNYRRLVELLRLPGSDYQRFMDFLRHHDLKP